MKIIVLFFSCSLFFFNSLQTMQKFCIGAIIENAEKCGLKIEGLEAFTHVWKVWKQALQEEKLYKKELKKKEMLLKFFNDTSINFESLSESASDTREEKLKELIKNFARKYKQKNKVQESREHNSANTKIPVKKYDILVEPGSNYCMFIQNPNFKVNP